MPRGTPESSVPNASDPPDWAGTLGELGLSSQQTEIVRLILDAKSDKQIAARLNIRVPTVRTYLDRISRRFGVTGRTELIMRLVAERDAFLERHKNLRPDKRKDSTPAAQDGNIARKKS